MFIKRDTHRVAAPVADSWKRLERWYQTHAPEMSESLRPGALEERISSFEERTGLKLPDDVRESYLIHDGQSPPHPGAMVGQPYDPLDNLESHVRTHREWCESLERRDADNDLDTNCRICPVDAIQCRYFHWKWIALGNYDSNCVGVDLDPGPNGVFGQVIDFGKDNSEWMFVLALSWAHFLEDIADELEAGNLVITRNAGGHVERFGRTGRNDQAMHNFFDEWSKAKLPASFQNVGRAVRKSVHPGVVVTGELARTAQDRVNAFVRSMHEYELTWLEVRPIHHFGYGRLAEHPRFGMSTDGLRVKSADCTPNISESDSNEGGQELCREVSEALAAGDPVSAIKAAGAFLRPIGERLQIGVYVEEAVRGYRAAFKKHCTDRERCNDGGFIQVYPPYYDRDRDRVAEVRQVSAEKLLVYMQPVEGITTRYHLIKNGDKWLIDFKDETTDHACFRRKALLFGVDCCWMQ